ncbi:ABC transporter substrate-binding protein [Cytobacillus purgationiresistens]|uniref:MarR-like DNA-binding transcriptional regulator SgrR of sgrS sRNA n=1 Tax=Cytobacillus purgationiresistens TaxID=863449 RepID=A0ABU0AEJ1_9BACI|nr:ABC transporter substrate-binding protein [Cytobacillus purgationiresistens]MDQ0268505.1 MarR-like DNA-binding transcriptional regulator SgrR of sgrS sRNA [Cytobacillus purgationiresistens]
MKYIEYCKKLTGHFQKDIETETSIVHLAKIFSCSDRYVKTIIHSLHNQGLLEWRPRKGRGNKPTLIMHQTTNDLFFMEACLLVEKGEYKNAFHKVSFLEKHRQIEFQSWFDKHLGVLKSAGNNDDVLRYSFYKTELQLDPLKSISRHDRHFLQQIYDQLVEYDSHSGKLFPKIAHHWDTHDGIVWTFYLRKSVYFHNHTELTSKDIKYTFERMSPNDQVRKMIKGMNIINKHIIRMTLHGINHLFPRYLASIKLSIIPMKTHNEQLYRLNDAPIGCGPYQLVKHTDELIRLDVFPEYYGYRPWLNRVEIIFTPEDYQSSQVHPFSVQTAHSSWEESLVEEEGADYISINCHKNGPLKEKKIRKYIYHHILSNDFCLDNEVVANSFLTEKSANAREIGLNEEIKAMITDFTLTIAVQQIRPGVNHEREAKVLQNQLEAIGVKANIVIINMQKFQLNDVLQKCDLFIGGVAFSDDLLLAAFSSIQSPDLFIYTFLNAKQKQIFNTNLERIKRSTNECERWKIYYQIEDFLKAEGIVKFLNHRSHKIFKPSDSPFENIELDSNGRVDYRKVWKKN